MKGSALEAKFNRQSKEASCSVKFLEPEFRTRPVGGCDALVASCRSDFATAGKNATGASLSPSGDEASPPLCGDEASPLLSAGRFGVRV